jgi:uncharacterized repeat protein (TIGR01451 family)
MRRSRVVVWLLVPSILAAALILLASTLFRSRALQSMPDLAVVVYVDPRDTDPFAPGKEITYQIYYINQGGYVANDVRIVDTLPEYTTYVSSSQPGFVLVQGGPDQVVWVRNRLSVFERGWLSFTVRVDDDAPVGIELRNNAYILCLDPESNYDDNESTIESYVRPTEADLRVTKHLWQNSGSLAAGNEIVFEIEPENWGGSTANSVRITDTLPADCTYLSDNTTSSGFTTVQTGTLVVWTKATMAPNTRHPGSGAGGNLYVHCQVAGDWTPDRWLENGVEISTLDAEYSQDNNLARWAYKPDSDRRYGAAVTSVDERTMRLLSDGGFDYLLYYLDWSEIEPVDNEYNWADLDRAVWQAWRYNLRLVVRVDRAPAWARGAGTASAPPGNPAKLGEFLQVVAGRWPRQLSNPDKAQIYGYVIWNEPNLAAEWGGNAPHAPAYTSLLQAAYNGVKAASSHAWVISAGLAPTGDDPPHAVDDRIYLQQMYTAGAGSSFDYLGANPMGFAYAPDDASDPNGYHFARAEEWRAIMEANGDAAKDMFGTETGWLRDTPIDLGSSYNWMKVSEINQAHYLARAYHKARCEWGDWLGPMTTFAAGEYSETDHPYWFGITDQNRDPLRAYLTLRNAATRGPADLWLEKELVDPLRPGQEFRYVIRYTNIGGQTATGVVMTDTLPAGADYVADTGGGTLTPAGDEVVWSPGDVGTCTYEAITLTLRLISGDPDTALLNNRVEANTMPGEPYTDDNVAVAINPLPDLLAIGKSVTPARVGPGQPLTYTLAFSNTGEITATGVVISDIVPVGPIADLHYAVSGVAITPTGGISYTWQVEDLAPGESGVITLTGLISPGVSGAFSLTNRATISATSVDLYWPNDTSVVSSTVDAEPPLPPALSSPVDGAATNDDTPALTWNPSPSADAAGYLLDFDGAVQDVGSVTQALTGLLADGTYTWTVAAYDLVGNTGVYTGVWSFTVDTDLPQPPSLISPTNAITLATNTPALTWGASPSDDVTGYLLDLDGSVQDVGHVTQTLTGTLAEGGHAWTVAAYDAAGNTSAYTEPWTFSVDTIPPPPVLLSPADGAALNDDTPTLTWNACPCADIAGYLLDIDGAVQDVGNVTQTLTGVLANDTYTWTVAAYDATGHTSAYTDTWSFSVDTEPPLPPVLTSPLDGTLTGTASLTLTWQASPSADAAGYLLDFDGTVQDLGDTTWFLTGLLADGTYTWTVAARDAAGNTSAYTDTWSFTVDTVPPPPGLVSPADGAIVGDTTPALTWNASAAPDIAGYLLDLDGTVQDMGNVTQTIAALLADGTYTWTVAARDAAGHTSAYTDTWSFSVDSQPPLPPTLLSPADGLTITHYAATLTWGASPSADVAGYLLSLNGVLFDVGYTNQYTNATLADGTYTWTVAAYDAAGNTGAYTDTWSFIIDTTPLPPALRSPADSVTIADDTPTLTWKPSVSPDTAGYMLNWEGAVYDVGNVTAFTTSILAEDTYTWTVASYNDSWYISVFTDTWAFAVDTTAPALPVLDSPADGTLTNTTSLTLAWQASPSADTAGYLLDLNGVVQDVGNTTHWLPGILADGAYTWTVAAYDTVSNTSAYTGTWSFTVDATAPAPPALASPANSTLTDTTSFTLTWQPSPSADLAGYRLDFDGAVQDVGNTTQYPTGLLADGAYSWTAAAYDGLNNTSAFTDAWSFTVDTTAPGPPALVSPADGARTTDRTPALTWQASPSPDVTGYFLEFDGVVLDVGDVTRHTVGPLAYGTFDWTVAAYDALGHTSAFPGSWSFSTEPHRVYLPLLARGYVLAPDLVVERIVVASDDVQVIIRNQGNATAHDDFWVDVYIAPRSVPIAVNQIWPDLADEGLVWGVTADLPPGGVLTLTVGDDYYVDEYSQVTWPLAPGTPVYAQVDSANAGTTYGAVLEIHEVTGGAYNNIAGPAYPPAASDGGAGEGHTPGHPGPVTGHRLPPRR